MKLWKNILFIIHSVNACFTLNDIHQNGYTYYNNKVYDISSYKHPGGSKTLSKAIGNDLSPFFNNNKYDFHLSASSNTFPDLKKLYIGDLCGNTPTSITDAPITDAPITDTQSLPTKKPSKKPTTNSLTDCTKVSTTEPTSSSSSSSTTTEAIVNSSNHINYFVFIHTFIALFYCFSIFIGL